MTKLQVVDTYLLPQHDVERERLDLQQSLHARVIPTYPTLLPTQQIHEELLASLNGSSKILDSAFGSGSWLFNMAKAVPNSQMECVGIDIDLSKLSPGPLPSNFTIIQASVLNLPAEWTNHFDYIHQTYLIAALSFASWHTAISELLRVLKPGGWLVLGEAGIFNNVGPYTRKLEAILRVSFGALEKDLGILDYLPGLLRGMSFVKGDYGTAREHIIDPKTITTQYYQMPLCGSAPSVTPEQKQLIKDTISTYTTLFFNMRDFLFKRSPEGIKCFGINTPEEFNRFMDDVREEWEKSDRCYYEFGVVSARKA